MDHQHTDSLHASPGLVAGMMTIVRNFFGLALNRIELAALEFSEVCTNFLKLFMLLGLGLVAAWFAFAYWSVLVVVLTWNTWGWKILLVLAALFTLLALGMFLYARSMLVQGKLSMPATLSELRKDRDALL